MSVYKFGDIAFNSTEKKKPSEEDKETYIGLEHLDSGSLSVTRWGSDVAPKGEKLLMKKGDVLFGKRRAYQKKVAIAPFDGIFSAHGMVLRPRENVIDKNFFPLFISSDYFLDTAINISVGSLSPTINWSDLKKLEFNLPDLDEQKRLAEVLWAAESLRMAYKNLLTKSDELIKAQFVVMFGDPVTNPELWPMHKLSELLVIERGGSPRPIHDYITESSEGVNWIKIGDAEANSKYITKTEEKIKVTGISKSRHVSIGDLILSNSMSFGHPYIMKIEGYIHDGWLVLHDEKELFNQLFLHAILSSSYAYDYFSSMARGGVVNNLNKELVGGLVIPLPPLPLQRRFADFVERVDKSKSELQTALSNLEALMKSVMRENLG